jgi:GT2 family glycosyltransferase
VGTAPQVSETTAPRVSVVFLLYRSADVVPSLLEALVRQSHPSFARQADWLEAIFMDDGSADGTADAVERALAGAGSPAHYRLVVNPRNLGLAGTLNEAFARARAPFVLTCHLDCRFGDERYVASLLELIEGRPRAAAITGKPAVPKDVVLPFAEKLNVIANLMDVLPDDSGEELVRVGFAEGRCDVFRAEALRAVGGYDTHLRVSGEDQVLSAKLRRAGWEIWQAPRVVYQLSVSGEQDSVSKLVRHQRLFGRTDPYILFAVPGSHDGLIGARAGKNRRRRALLRGSQVAACGVYGLAVASLVLAWPWWPWLGALVALVAARTVLYRKHARAVRLRPSEIARLAVVQPLLDVAFSEGLIEGLWYLARGRRGGSID